MPIDLDQLREVWTGMPDPDEQARSQARMRLLKEIKRREARPEFRAAEVVTWRPHGRFRVVLAGVLATFLLFIGAAYAFDLGVPVLNFRQADKPSSDTSAVKNFETLDKAAPPRMATGVIANQTREVTTFRLSTGESVVLWVAPTRAGGFCVEYSDGAAGCDRDRTVLFSRGLSIQGSVRADATEIQGNVLVTGWTLLHEGATVEVRFADGDGATVPLTWVSAPIDAGFFLYAVPRQHRSLGHAPTALVLNDAGGHEIREVSVPSIFGPE